MPIVMSFDPQVNSYTANYSKTRPNVEARCPDCGAVMAPWGKYCRFVYLDDSRIYIPVYRWRCPKCGKTSGVLPDFLAPYLRHPTQTRESCLQSHLEGSTIEKAAEQAGVEVRSASRWIARVKRILDGAISLVSRLIADLTIMVIWPRPRASVKGARGRMFLLFDLGKILCENVATRGATGVFPRINCQNLFYL